MPELYCILSRANYSGIAQLPDQLSRYQNDPSALAIELTAIPISVYSKHMASYLYN